MDILEVARCIPQGKVFKQKSSIMTFESFTYSFRSYKFIRAHAKFTKTPLENIQSQYHFFQKRSRQSNIKENVINFILIKNT